MEFEVSRCYTQQGEAVLIEYPQLKKYTYRIAEFDTLYMTINSLEELLKLQKDIDENLILDKDGQLVIYDGYIE